MRTEKTGWRCHKLATLWSRQVVSWWNPFHHLWRNAERTLVNFYLCMYDKQWEQKNNGDNGDDHEELNWKAGRFVKKRKSSEEKKLPFLLTRFIRKENLDKRGCKITEIVERHKIKADPIFGDQFISGMNCVNVFCSPQYMTFDPLQLFNINQTW